MTTEKTTRKKAPKRARGKSTDGSIPCLPSYSIIDPELDAHLDPDLFQRGFKDGLAHLEALPKAWARNYAATVTATAPDPDDDEPSYTRGFRAALWGFLKHG